MEWYKRVTDLDPYYGYGWLGYALCLDFIGQHAESWPYYEKAIADDPNGYFTAGWVGWHYMQTGDFPAARTWFERSVRLEWENNDFANNIAILNQRMIESATNTNPFRLDLISR